MDKKKRTFWIIIAALLVVGSIGIGISQGDVGINGEATGGDGSKGVYGEASNTGDVRNYGGYFVADGIRGRGIYGKASNTGDAINYGGFFYASGKEGRGVFGQANGGKGIGVKGWASDDGSYWHYGGHFTASGSNGKGVYGKAECTEHTMFGKAYGGYFESASPTGMGAYAENIPSGNYAELGSWKYGVFGKRVDKNNYGALGTINTGVSGWGDLCGGYFSADGEKGVGIRAFGGPNGYAADFMGNMRIRAGRAITPVLEITGGSDLSEQFKIRGIEAEISPSPGMVVSIDPEHPGDLVVSNDAYDRRVAGIISGAGGLNPGMLMGQNGSEADGGYPVALSGRVYCWADASKGPIEPGDLLTTSETPGHAMKVTDHDRAYGAIIGKAMTGLEEGKGLVLVLVALQ